MSNAWTPADEGARVEHILDAMGLAYLEVRPDGSAEWTDNLARQLDGDHIQNYLELCESPELILEALHTLWSRGASDVRHTLRWDGVPSEVRLELRMDGAAGSGLLTLHPEDDERRMLRPDSLLAQIDALLTNADAVLALLPAMKEVPLEEQDAEARKTCEEAMERLFHTARAWDDSSTVML